MKTLPAISQLTSQQELQMRNLKAHFPFRIVWAELTPSNEFSTFAHYDKRSLNKSARNGNAVFVFGN